MRLFDVGLLILVNPPWWDPFGEPVAVGAVAASGESARTPPSVVSH
jgi:hypothetical protein